jgi:hypothetical protein
VGVVVVGAVVVVVVAQEADDGSPPNAGSVLVLGSSRLTINWSREV